MVSCWGCCTSLLYSSGLGEVAPYELGVGVVCRPGPARTGRGWSRTGGWPAPGPPPPGRRRRGCCGWTGCWGGCRPGPARAGRGWSHAGGWPPQPPRRLVGAGEVVAAGQGVGVVAPRTCSRWARVVSAGGWPRPVRPATRRRRRGCCGWSGCRGGCRPGPARARRGSLVQGDGPPSPPGRLVGAGEVVAAGQGVGVVWRPGPARARRGCARTGGWPAQSARPPGRRRRGCCGWSGCRGGRRPGPARGRRGSARAGGWPAPAARRLVGAARLLRLVRVLGWFVAQDLLALGEGGGAKGDGAGVVAPPVEVLGGSGICGSRVEVAGDGWWCGVCEGLEVGEQALPEDGGLGVGVVGWGVNRALDGLFGFGSAGARRDRPFPPGTVCGRVGRFGRAGGR